MSGGQEQGYLSIVCKGPAPAAIREIYEYVGLGCRCTKIAEVTGRLSQEARWRSDGDVTQN